MKSKSRQYTLKELTEGLDVTIKGDPSCVITGVSQIQQAQSGHLTFLTNALYKKHLESTQASAVILSEEDAASCSCTAIISRNPYFTYAKMATYFADESTARSGIHPSAVIGTDCEIDPTAFIGAHCSIGNNVKIGANTHIDANVTIYSDVSIGKRTRIASGVVIGSDGFGFANQKGAWHKVPQLGGVEIGDDVDIGANTTIDRGAIENTVIENGVKLDNLIQVGHNVRIGANTIIAGCVAIAGSTTIGKHCMIGGATCFAGHMTIADQTMITGMTAVTKSIAEPGIYSSGIVGAVPNHEFRKNNARFHRLESLMKRVKSLETVIKEMAERNET